MQADAMLFLASTGLPSLPFQTASWQPLNVLDFLILNPGQASASSFR
ncbi:hypothetical protein B14911_08717 [Bacillus sp. NRRL B-14911]|nr:hypothetical protein B14911_08717 [Bacillus sp. NRRL B-14911]